MKRVAVLGMGYVGCVTAACLSQDGHQVAGVDIDDNKVNSINAGRPPVSEPGLDELLKEQVDAGRLTATTDVRAAIESSEIALIAVGTPSAKDGSVNTRAVEAVVDQVASIVATLDHPFTIVLRSTLLPGILEQALLPLVSKHVGDRLGNDVHVCNNPEFLRETTAIKDYYDPPYVLVGAEDDNAAENVLKLYQEVPAEQIVTDTRTAALVKYACNSFHALKVAFGNEIGTLAKEFDANGHSVMQILCKDQRLNISPAYLRPGYGFGGSCLPKDVRALTRYAQRQAVNTELLNAILPSNESHITRGLEAIKETGHRKIGLVGLSFKAGTDDLRESPLVILAERLLGQGFELRIFDPGVQVTRLVGTNLAYVDQHLQHLAALLVDNEEEIYTHSDLLVLGTDIANQMDLSKSGGVEQIDLRKDLVVPSPETTAVQ